MGGNEGHIVLMPSQAHHIIEAILSPFVIAVGIGVLGIGADQLHICLYKPSPCVAALSPRLGLSSCLTYVVLLRSGC